MWLIGGGLRPVPLGLLVDEEKLMATFYAARHTDLQLVREPADVELNHRGQIIKRIEGEMVEFNAGVFKTDDAELVEWLRGHPDNGVYFVEQGVDEPRPTVNDQLARIASAAARQDIDEIEAAVAEEKETHNRDTVLSAAAAALEGIVEATEPVGEEASDEPEVEPWISQPSATD